MPKRLAIVGMGKLGLPMAALYASRGYEVSGIDQNEGLVKEVEQGKCPIQETGLAELLASCRDKLKVTTTYDLVGDSDIVFIIVPTPSNKDGAFSNEYVISAIRSIGEVVKGQNQLPLIVITSTVMPGTMETVVRPELEKITGKKCGVDFGMCYNPEFIALGSVIRDMENPDAILIGESDVEAGSLLSEFYYSFHGFNPPPICQMSLWNAEVTKLALNVYVTTKISLANTLTEVCGHIPDGNVDDVTGFLGLDSRIGAKFFKGGLGFGGECFPRDSKAFIAFADKYGLNCPIQVATDEVNREHTQYIVQKSLNILLSEQQKTTVAGACVSVLGVTYKPNSPVVTESVALELVDRLSKLGIKVRVYDPMGMKGAKKKVNNPYVIYTRNAKECLNASDLCILATPWEEFKKLMPSVLLKHMRTPCVLDCWRVLDKAQFMQGGVKYYAVGVNDG